MNRDQVDDFMWACAQADVWLTKGIAFEKRVQTSSTGHGNRVSIVDCWGEEVVLFPVKK